jgi:hypothetical protein
VRHRAIEDDLRLRRDSAVKNSFKWAIGLGVGLAFGGAAFFAGRAWAGGIPTTVPLVYTGLLQNADGSPFNATGHYIEIKLWDAATAGTQLCDTSSQPLTVDSTGHFSLPLIDTVNDCANAVGTHPDTYVEVLLDGAVLGAKRSKLGAVPYAIEANHAVRAESATSASSATAADSATNASHATAADSATNATNAGHAATADSATTATSASGPLDSRLATIESRIAPAGLIAMFAGTCPAGWQSCDGTNGSPDLIGAYPKAGASFAAKTGSDTHQHGISLASTNGAGAHTPQGTVSVASNGSHSHVGYLDWGSGSTYIFARFATGIPNWQATHQVGPIANSSSGINDTGGLDMTVAGTHAHTATLAMNAVGDHSHTIPATNSDSGSSEPTHATLVFCMKL